MRRELRLFIWIAGIFLFAYFVPFSQGTVRNAVFEAFALLQEYAREHVLLCLVPAFFIAGAIAVFVSQASVIKYLGGQAKKAVAYGVASVSGAILAVCSCTVLPLFAGIYKRGAGLGPAIAFLYSGPAINILAIILTGRILGIEFGLARALGAILFSLVIGLVMQALFRKEEKEKQQIAMPVPEEEKARPLWKTALYVAAMIGFLVFVNWGKPGSIAIHTTAGDTIIGTRAGETAEAILYKPSRGEAIQSVPRTEVETVAYAPSVYASIYHNRFYIAVAFVALLLILLRLWFTKAEITSWGGSTWFYAKLILPYLFGGVLIAGFLLGRPGHDALIPAAWIGRLVGGNSWGANAFASVAGAFMYFATLTELPILQGLQGAGMGDGPALSLPNMLVIRKLLGTKKTLAYITLVCIAATLTGKLFGAFVGP